MTSALATLFLSSKPLCLSALTNRLTCHLPPAQPCAMATVFIVLEFSGSYNFRVSSPKRGAKGASIQTCRGPPVLAGGIDCAEHKAFIDTVAVNSVYSILAR